MGTPILQLTNSTNWSLVYSQAFYAQQITATSYALIPKITVPLLLERHILAVHATSATAKDTWHFAGFLNQNVQLGLLVGGGPDAESVQRRKIWLNRITLLILPSFAPNYSISFNVPHWFKDISLSVWEYIGPEADSTEELIQRVEFKVDQIIKHEL